MSLFTLPFVYDFPSGWGPNDHAPDSFNNIPFASFAKSELVGKVMDWEAQPNYQQRTRQIQATVTAEPTSAFAYKHEDDETSFQLVDNKPQKIRAAGGMLSGRRPFQQQSRRGMSNNGPWQQRGRGASSAVSRGGRGRLSAVSNANQRQYQQQRNFSSRGRFDRVVKPRDPSVEIKRNWKLLQTYPLADFNKLNSVEIPDAEDLGIYGNLDRYDQACDTITSKSQVTLKRFESRQFFSATTSADPVLQQLSNTSAGTVYANDVILALLLCANRSIYSWDIVITKANGTLTLDKRQKSLVDFWTVSETGNEQGLQFDAKEDGTFPINHPTSLATEATFINQNFSQQVVSRKGADPKKDVLVGANPNPFLDQLEPELEAASCAYRYRRWNLGKHTLVARTEVNGFAAKKNSSTNENIYLCIKALNEFDSKATGSADFRLKLDTQGASVFATELKNNSSKLARWATQAVLSGADEMKLGYISRVVSDNPASHVIVAVNRIPTDRFATQVGLNLPKMWAFLEKLFDEWQSLEDGKYLLMKEPNEAKLTLYSLPNSFVLDDEEIEEDDD